MDLRYAVSNLPRPRPQLGAISPITLMMIPVFTVMLENKGKTKTAAVGFDTGLQNAHLQIPSSLASSLGILATGTENRSDATQDFVVQKGVIDKISAPGVSNCSLQNAKVLFFPDAPFLIGNDFISDVGADISYEGGSPQLTCDGPMQAQAGQPRAVPIFSVALIHGGKSQTVSAFFDTGWEGTDIAIPWALAQQLGLPALKTITARTHTGTVTLTQSKLDRLALQEIPCYVDGADVDILPIQSPIQRVIVGEGFFKKIDGRIGYDSQGALFACGRSSAIARSTGTGIIPPEAFPIDRMDPNLPLLVGGAAILGLGVLVSVALLLRD